MKKNNINDRQKEFYQNFKKNFATRIWFKIRNGLFRNVRKDLQINDLIYSQHKEWFGDLAEKKVLDLGCYAGNALSFYLATNAKEYIGIDLSESAIKILENEIIKIPTARVEAIDFLSEEFKESKFDLIYAYGVLHHFKNVQELIDKLNEKLNEDGRIISYDPINTSMPVRVVRAFYRPFQSDKDWEWPFSKKTLKNFQSSFIVLSVHGVLGKTKWYSLFKLLPLKEKFKESKAKKWKEEDWGKSSESNKYLYSCLQITMHLKKIK